MRLWAGFRMTCPPPLPCIWIAQGMRRISNQNGSQGKSQVANVAHWPVLTKYEEQLLRLLSRFQPRLVRGFVILGAALLSLIPPGDEAIATLVQKKQHWLLRGNALHLDSVKWASPVNQSGEWNDILRIHVPVVLTLHGYDHSDLGSVGRSGLDRSGGEGQ